MEIDILTGSILIGLFLTNVILIFLDSRQQSRFRQTEKHLQDALRQTESRLRDALLDKIEEVERLLKRYHRFNIIRLSVPLVARLLVVISTCAGLAVRRMSTLVKLR